MVEVWVPIITAIIGAIGTIIAASIGHNKKVVQKEGELETKRPNKILLGGVGLVVGAVIGVLITFLLLPSDPCLSATIDSPQGANDRRDASAFQASSNEKLSWKPTDCVMVVQYYQNNSLIDEYKNVVSGTELNIGVPGSGETELKIWRDGAKKPSDNVWVWVK